MYQERVKVILISEFRGINFFFLTKGYFCLSGGAPRPTFEELILLQIYGVGGLDPNHHALENRNKSR